MINLKAALYTRVSTEEQAETGFSLEAQKKRLYEYCNQNMYEVYKLYTDEGISGHSITKRKALKEMLEDARQRKFDCLIVYKTDRLSRNLLDLLTIKKELDSAEIELIISDESIDTKDDVGMTMFSIMGAFAELERKKISERMMLGKRQLVQTTGKKSKLPCPPFGYIYDDIDERYLVDPLYKDDILLIYSLFDEGWSYNQITQELVKKNINFGKVSKKKWFVSDVTRILRNPIYKGFTGISYSDSYHGKKCKNEAIIVKASNVEPLLSEELWDRVNKRASVKKKSFARKYASDKFVFFDVLYCDTCKYKLSTNQSTERKLRTGESIKYLYYLCNSKFKLYTSENECSGFIMNITKLEEQFLNFIKNMEYKTSSIQLQNNTKDSNKEKEKLIVSLKTKNRQRQILLDKLMSETITDDDYKIMNKKLLDEISKIEDNLNSLTEEQSRKENKQIEEQRIIKQITGLKQLVSIWSLLPDHEKKSIINQTISKIYVSKNGITKIEFK